MCFKVLAIGAAFTVIAARRATGTIIRTIKTCRTIDDIDVLADNTLYRLPTSGAYGDGIVFHGLINDKNAALWASIAIFHGIPFFLTLKWLADNKSHYKSMPESCQGT